MEESSCLIVLYIRECTQPATDMTIPASFSRCKSQAWFFDITWCKLRWSPEDVTFRDTEIWPDPWVGMSISFVCQPLSWELDKTIVCLSGYFVCRALHELYIIELKCPNKNKKLNEASFELTMWSSVVIEPRRPPFLLTSTIWSQTVARRGLFSSMLNRVCNLKNRKRDE